MKAQSQKNIFKNFQYPTIAKEEFKQLKGGYIIIEEVGIG